MRSEAEIAAERADELQRLIAKAKKRGEETQARLQFEEAEKLQYRKEQEKYYKAPLPDDGQTPTTDADDDQTPADDKTDEPVDK